MIQINMKECVHKTHTGTRLLPASAFHKNAKKSDGLASYCKECMKVICRAWDKKNRKASRKRHKAKRQQKVQLLRERFNVWKHERGCSHCGEDDFRCLDMHHVSDDKDFELSKGVGCAYSWEKLMKEAEKCIVVCANCHRKIHWK